MLPRQHRLTRPAEFTTVLRGGRDLRTPTRKAGTALLVVHRRDTLEPHPARVGFIVSGAVGNAVVRHRVTRRLRALMAQRLCQLPRGCLLVVRATPAAARASYSELAAELDSALRRVAREPSRNPA
ncbi:ribonuclease P protein component [Ornithinicoccus halotolerans]|uniref:ribonuclease P protein component n=1 Tax=Ornithinicoccus halotolerans TaxID=1748220 RepID=UPI00129545DD|nr:ribonuclease P protein component [Ornithinicoccus halotolerans]